MTKISIHQKGLMETNLLHEEYIANIADKFTFIYFGNEFCMKAFPSLELIIKKYNYYHSLNLKPVLLTPLVTNKYIKSFDTIFSFISTFLGHQEVVVNDFGLLYLLKNKYPSITITMGRLLEHLSKDRLLNSTNNNEQKKERKLNVISDFSIKAVLISSFKTFFSNKIEVHYFYPYVPLSITRRCLFSKESKILEPEYYSSCNFSCLSAVFKDDITNNHYLMGNTQIMRKSDNNLETIQANRFVLEIRISDDFSLLNDFLEFNHEKI